MQSKELSKEIFYQLRGETYSLTDPEALIRYERAMTWLDLKESTVVREVGCKFAILRDLLEKAPVKTNYAAVDIDEATLQKIPRYDSNTFICQNVNLGLPFENLSADYIFCLEVLEHLENPTYFLAEVKRVLKPGGKLVLSVPNPYCWMELIWNIRRLPDSEGHIASFSHLNINALLGFAGLKLNAIQGTYTHIPFSRRLTGTYKRATTDNIFLTRSYLYLIEKPQ